ncbi:MAG: hypothetical protein EOP04_12990 [Proteobacteria bacterium]|nr:MAG: hypothetical protein EOP04_12990 [Pseudomonadota bacterium]
MRFANLFVFTHLGMVFTSLRWDQTFKKVGGGENDALKSLLQQFAAVSMLALRATSDGDDNARVKTLRKNHPKAVAELDDFAPKNLLAYSMKLTLPEDFRMDCD